MSEDLTLRDIVLRMEGAMNTEFAHVKGELRSLHRDAVRTDEAIAEIKTEVGELQTRRFPLPVIGGIMSVTAVCLSAFTLVRGG